METRTFLYEASFRWPRKLVAGAAGVATIGLCALAYFFSVSAGEKTSSQTAELAPAVQSSPATTVQAAPGVPGRSPAPAAAAAWPDPSPINPARPEERGKASPKGAPPAPLEAAVPQTPSASQNRDVVYLQRPGVHIRSTPSTNGNAVGTAPKGTRFQVTNREAEWVQVESGRLKGWINARFLAPNEPP